MSDKLKEKLLVPLLSAIVGALSAIFVMGFASGHLRSDVDHNKENLVKESATIKDNTVRITALENEFSALHTDVKWIRGYLEKTRPLD